MSVKKILSIIMALAMVLTMTSFSAFAEGEAKKIVPISVSSPQMGTNGGNVNYIIDGIAFGASSGNYFKGNWRDKGNGIDSIASGGNFIFEFENPVSLTSIWFNMGGCHITHAKLYGSNTTNDFSDKENWDHIGNIETSFVKVDESDGNKGYQYTYTLDEPTDYYKYYRIDTTGLASSGNLVWLESYFYGSEYSNQTPVEYTVNYVDEETNILDTYVGEGYVGQIVTAELKEIDGYITPETVEPFTLTDDPAQNVITVTYAKITASTPVEITPASATSVLPADTSLYGTIGAVIDGKEGGNKDFFRSTNHTNASAEPGADGNFNFVVDLGGFYTITKFYSSWGVSYASKIALWGSADGVDFGDEPFALLAPGGNGKTVSVNDESGSSYRYIKVDVYEVTSGSTLTNPACKEVTFYGVADASMKSVEYTVNYVDEQKQPIATPKTSRGIVGDVVTETAIDIVGYAPVETEKTIELVDGTNTIEFVYKARAVGNYVVKHIDTNGEDVATTETGSGYVGDSVTVRAKRINHYSVDKQSETFEIVDGETEIVFTYTLLDPDTPASLVPVDVTTDIAEEAASEWGDFKIQNIIDGVAYAYSGDFFKSAASGATGKVVFDFGTGHNITEITSIMGGTNMLNGVLYATNDLDGELETIHTFNNLSYTLVDTADASAGRTNTQTISHEGYYRYFIIEVTELCQSGQLVWLESYFTGTYEAPGLDIGDSLVSEGSQIRLPQGSISAGIRFGATVDKETVGIVGEYKYDENAATTFGMFLIPQNLLEGATFADYLAANDYAGQALKVPAQRIYDQDASTVTYTAVLVGIPEGEYDRDIVAVPYVCVEGEYAFGEEMTRNYSDVATSVAAAYEAGEVALSATQITLIEGIIGRPLVAPEVA